MSRSNRLSLLAALGSLVLLGHALFPPAPGPALPAAAFLVDRVIALDPGHGGYDPGVLGSGGEVEKEIVLDVALRLGELLTAAGVRVRLTRATDCHLMDPEEAIRLGSRKRSDMEARLRLVRDAAPDVFVSLHANSFPSPRVWGPQTFFSREGHPGSERLAACIQDSLNRTVPAANRRPNPRNDHFLLRNVDMPAVTVELGFVSNPAEARRLMDDAHRDALAWAVFHGLARYFQEVR